VTFSLLVSSRVDTDKQGYLASAQPGSSATFTVKVVNNSPASFTFSGADISDQSTANSFTIHIGGQLAQSRLRPRAAGAACSVGLVLQSLDVCSLTLVFSPPTGSSGAITAVLNIHTDAADDPTLSVVLIGLVQQPPKCSSFSGLSASFTAYNGSLPLSFSVSGKTSGDPATSTWSLSVSGYGGSAPFAEQANFSSANPYKFVIFTYKDQGGNVVGELDGYLQYNATAGTMTLSLTPSGDVGNVSINPSTVSVTSTPGACS
jgi:hypothetical protein